MKKQKVFIDTDMGNDDILAISMLLCAANVRIIGISLVSGVTSWKKGLINLLKLLKFYNLQIPIYIPFRVYQSQISFPKKDIKRAENLELIPSLKNLQLGSIESKSLNNLSKTSANDTTLVALGPLTNVAFLIKSFKRVILMGGGISIGNIPPLMKSEYNIALDPTSAQEVFNAEIPIQMVSVDATNFVPCTQDFKAKIQQTNTNSPISKIIREIILNNDGDFDNFYDPLLSTILINPEIIKKTISGKIKVVQKGPEMGKTILTENSLSKLSIVLQISPYKFYSLVLKIIKGEKI